jgi:hypothetical protein
MDYEFIALKKSLPTGADYINGHAMRWPPCDTLNLELIVSSAAIARDFADIPLTKKYEKPGVQAMPHPGNSVREVVAKYKGGLAYFNAGELGMFNFPIIVGGELIAKPNPAKSLGQRRWTPLNDSFTFFLQYPSGQVEIRDLPIINNQLVVPVPKGTYGFSAPYLFKSGRHLPLKNPAPGQPLNSQEVLFPAGGSTSAPISALGLDTSDRVVRVALVGDSANPDDTTRLPTELDLADYLRELNIVDALYTGASGDVQYYDRQTQTLVAAPERPKSADGRWVLRAGQTERGLTVIAVLMRKL